MSFAVYKEFYLVKKKGKNMSVKHPVLLKIMANNVLGVTIFNF